MRRSLLLVAVAGVMACSSAKPRLPSAPSVPGPVRLRGAGVGAAAPPPALLARNERPSPEEAAFDGHEPSQSDATRAGDARPADDIPVVAPEGRVTSVAFISWIRARPHRGSVRLGYLRVGTSIPLRDMTPIRNDECARGWYAVVPRGYVCNNDDAVVTSEQRPLHAGEKRYLDALEQAGPHDDGALPYGYALSDGTPMYGRIPTTSEQTEMEAWLGKPGSRRPGGVLSPGHEELAMGEPIASHEDAPSFLVGHARTPASTMGTDPYLVRRVIPNGSMLSFAKAFEAEGRTWLLTPDLTVVPADRVRPFRPSAFHGVELSEELSLPLAWIKRHAAQKFRRDDGGRLVPSGESFSPRTSVPLVGHRVLEERTAYWETNEPGVFVAESEVATVLPNRRRPGVAGPSDKWIVVSILKGILVAYEGDRPVFTTLISAGRGGPPPDPAAANRALVAGNHTPVGIYRIEWKDRFATMSPDPGTPRSFWIADVPNTQYFRGPFALHAAFWHEDFGEMKSGGCVNLSPSDAEWLFRWTGPEVPNGWQAASQGAANGVGTIIQIVP